MTIWLASFSYIGYSLGAIACGLAALWIGSKGDEGRNDRVPAVVALALTANWCFASASFGPVRPIVDLTEIARNLAWLFMLLRLFGNDGRDETLRLVRPTAVALAFVEMLQLALLLIARHNSAVPDLAAITETANLFRLMVCVGALVLLHNLYVGAAASSRLILRWNVAALAWFWSFDLNYFAIAYITSSVPLELDAVRGLAAAIFAVPFAIGFNRGSSGLEFRPSRAVTFRFLSLSVIGGYLAVMVALARSLDMLAGDLARMAQVGLIIAAGALALIWLPSNRLRGWLQVTAIKHFFKHRYDYREEWIRFTDTIGTTERDNCTLQERVVKALADITDSQAGVLLMPDGDGTLEVAANWRWPEITVPALALPAELGKLLEKSELVIAIDEVREGIDRMGEQALLPRWLMDDSRAWAVVPLLHFDHLVGLVVLSRPRVERKLDWEDFDLLKVVGRQVASYLAEQAGQAALLEAAQFDDFNRRIAFVMHDIKNLSSQVSLLLRNAEKHADKPEFRKDMLVTLRSSAEKLNTLLARLGQYSRQETDKAASVELGEAARRIMRKLGQIHPLALRRAEAVTVGGDWNALDQALGHLVQNAIDASEPTMPVMLDIYSDGVSGVIQVEDHGRGMSPEFLRSGLYKPFISSKSGGFGIGAFEARELIRSMGGRLDVESCQGSGTRFTVRLPLASAPRTIEHGDSVPANEVV